MARDTKPRLGRGLRSLISEPVEVALAAETPAQSQARSADTYSDNKLIMLSVEAVVASRFQARRAFDDESLANLAASIRSAGVMQPIAVRALDARAGAPAGAAWELVAGERRWRAARLAGLTRVPAIVANIGDREAAEWGIIENVQREDLNPMEAARAYRSLQREFGLTQEEIAERIGVDRSTVANIMRLSDLEASVQRLIESRDLSLGHAKALLGLPAGRMREALASRAVKEGWTVRNMETIAGAERAATASGIRREGGGGGVRGPTGPAPSANITDLEKRLGEYLGTRVRVRLGASRRQGRIEIEFYDLDQFDGVLTMIGFRAAGSLSD